ncbi:MAG: hypothetical protein JWQ85_3674 [Mucilaginibacter sp.]|nr:hypothetical protein [Mucilaginibacter sp.]
MFHLFRLFHSKMEQNNKCCTNSIAIQTHKPKI